MSGVARRLCEGSQEIRAGRSAVERGNGRKFGGEITTVVRGILQVAPALEAVEGDMLEDRNLRKTCGHLAGRSLHAGSIQLR